jgi:hypothetical protein
MLIIGKIHPDNRRRTPPNPYNINTMPKEEPHYFTQRGVCSYGDLIHQKELDEHSRRDEFDPNFDGEPYGFSDQALNLELTGRGQPELINWDFGWKPQPDLEYVEEQSERYWSRRERRWKPRKWYHEPQW